MSKTFWKTFLFLAEMLKIAYDYEIWLLGTRVNSGTFRLKKRTYNGPSIAQTRPETDGISPRDFRSSPRDSVERDSRLQLTRDVVPSSMYENGAVHVSRQSSSDSNSLESPHDQQEYNKLTDVVDVQVLARMQEDSKSFR